MLEMVAEGEQKHVMLSYQWDRQSTVMRINESLITRNFVTWFDLTNMKGSTMDAMRYITFIDLSRFISSCVLVSLMRCIVGLLSDAIEGADVMLYGVSLACESRSDIYELLCVFSLT
jgi:hypothetical protein